MLGSYLNGPNGAPKRRRRRTEKKSTRRGSSCVQCSKIYMAPERNDGLGGRETAFFPPVFVGVASFFRPCLGEIQALGGGQKLYRARAEKALSTVQKACILILRSPNLLPALRPSLHIRLPETYALPLCSNLLMFHVPCRFPANGTSLAYSLMLLLLSLFLSGLN